MSGRRVFNLQRVSYSEAATLADCEQKWSYRYLNRQPSDSGAAAHLGTLLHTVIGEWWWGEATMAELLDSLVLDVEDETLALGTWLLLRYEQTYARDRRHQALRFIGRELRFEQKLPYGDATIVAYIDGLAFDQAGKLWLVERKSMNNWSRLDTLTVDPQVTLYLWMARAAGLPVVGVLYDAILTYRWKAEVPTLTTLAEEVLAEPPGTGLTKKAAMEIARMRQARHPGVDRPAEDSFRTLWLDRTPEHIEEALAELQSAMQRRAALAFGSKPLRNIGRNCSYCPFRGECWEALAFPADNIDVEEEEL